MADKNELLALANKPSQKHHRYMRDEGWSETYHCIYCGQVSEGRQIYRSDDGNGVGCRLLPVRGCVRAKAGAQ